jgi:phosphoadenosine phosphosulfate reductase
MANTVERTLTTNDDNVGTFALALEHASALETLTWAVERYGNGLTFATGFGPEGCILIDLVGRHRLPIDIFTLDTGLLFPETRTLWKQLEDRYELTIRGTKPVQSVDEQALAHGDKLWESAPNRCCELRKVIPLKAELSNADAWITAIRRDQTPERSKALVVEWDEKFNIAKINPLVRWTKEDVHSHIHAHDVPYNPLHEQGYPSIGCWPCTTSIAFGEDDRVGRWRGIAKTECGLHGPMHPTVELKHKDS